MKRSQPLVIAHRGWSARYPENTLAAIRGAIDLGVDMVEIDLQQTRDGELIVFHDYRLDRICGVRARVKDKSLAEIRKLNSDIPTFAEVLGVCRGKMPLLVEIKGANGRDVAALIKKFEADRDAIVFSVKPQRMVEVIEVNPDIAMFGLIARHLSYRVKNLPSRLTIRGLGLSRALIKSQALVEKLQRRGWKLFVWTVDDELEMRRLIEWGVDGLITNEPDVALQMRKS